MQQDCVQSSFYLFFILNTGLIAMESLQFKVRCYSCIEYVGVNGYQAGIILPVAQVRN